MLRCRPRKPTILRRDIGRHDTRPVGYAGSRHGWNVFQSFGHEDPTMKRAMFAQAPPDDGAQQQP